MVNCITLSLTLSKTYYSAGKETKIPQILNFYIFTNRVVYMSKISELQWQPVTKLFTFDAVLAMYYVCGECKITMRQQYIQKNHFVHYFYFRISV